MIVILAVNKVHLASQRDLYCGSALGELNQVYGLNCLMPSAYSICRNIYKNIFIRCREPGKTYNISILLINTRWHLLMK